MHNANGKEVPIQTNEVRSVIAENPSQYIESGTGSEIHERGIHERANGSEWRDTVGLDNSIHEMKVQALEMPLLVNTQMDNI